MERLVMKARFCLATQVQPSEYDQLTLKEREAFFKAIEERNKLHKKSMKSGAGSRFN